MNGRYLLVLPATYARYTVAYAYARVAYAVCMRSGGQYLLALPATYARYAKAPEYKQT
jgi:hypothetical protein